MKPTIKLCCGALLSAACLAAAPVCPTTSAQTGTDSSGTGCAVLITFAASGSPTVTTPGLGPYDGTEDVTVGVINNSTSPVSTLTLSSASGTDAFGFETDGIQTFTANNGVPIGTGGVTGYEGPNSTFNTTGVSGGDGTLTIAFSPAISGSGGFDYFSLEGTPSIGSGITVVGGGPGAGGPGTGGPGTGGATPEPASLMLLGTGLLGIGGLVLRRSKQ